MINELSRLAQLDGKRRDILAKYVADKGLMFSAITNDIQAVIDEMDTATAVKASGWYFEAHAYAAELAAKYDVSIEIAAGVLSAVSPRMPWLRNKNVAAAILERFRTYSALSATDAAKEIGLALSANVAMAISIARGANVSDTLTGIKRQSFYNNIVDPYNGDSVTVDTWMINAIVRVNGVSKKDAEKMIRASETAMGGTGIGYFVIAEAVRNVAKRMNVHAHQVQAMYWVALAKDFNGSRTDIN